MAGPTRGEIAGHAERQVLVGQGLELVSRGLVAAAPVRHSHFRIMQSILTGSAILIRLIPVNLLLGLLPDPAMLRAYSLTHFEPLIHYFKTGNVAGWRRELDEKREWYRRRGIWLILYERGEILVWRNLLRKRSVRFHIVMVVILMNSLWLYYRTLPGVALNRCPTSIFLQTIRKAFEGTGEIEDGTIELEDLIVIIASCIDHVSYSFLSLGVLS